MRIAPMLTALLGCGNKPTATPTLSPSDAMSAHDAAAASALDAAVAPPSSSAVKPPVLSCAAKARPMGALEVVLDPSSLKGELLAFNTSTAPTRHMRVIGQLDGSATILVFDGYLPRDHTFKGTFVKRTEKLVRGKSVLGHLRIEMNEARLYLDGVVDLARGFESETAASGYFVCPPDARFITHLTP